MKRFLALILFLFTVPSLACADTFYSAAEVFAQAGSRWEESYDACGRRIDIQVDVFTPQADQVPVLRIAPREPAAVAQELIDSVVEYENSSAGRMRLVNPPQPMAPSSNDVWPRTTLHAISGLSDDAAYAAENPLTWGQAKERAAQLLSQWGFSQYSFDLNRPCDSHWFRGYALITGLLWNEAEMRKESEQGYYWLWAQQLLRGIPVWTDIRGVFRSHRQEAILNLGYMNVDMDSPDGGYALFVAAVDETEMLVEDIPLCSFEKVLSAYEEKIAAGNIRQADQLVFAYMMFRTGREYAVFPCWILRCLYMNNAADEVTVPEGMAWQDTEYELSLVANAQTGEIVDPYDSSRERDRLPEWISWQEVR